MQVYTSDATDVTFWILLVDNQRHRQCRSKRDGGWGSIFLEEAWDNHNLDIHTRAFPSCWGFGGTDLCPFQIAAWKWEKVSLLFLVPAWRERKAMVVVQRKMSSSSNDNSMRESMDDVQDDGMNLLDNHKQQQPKRKTLTWSEIPEWMQDNVFITAGYRAPTNSYVRCAQSLFYLHNESGPLTFTVNSS